MMPARGLRVIFLLIILLILASCPAVAMLNPAAVYCQALGHRYVTESRPEGDFGYCILPDGTKADAWAFFAGSTGTTYGACSRAGYQQVVSSDPGLCPFSAGCAVCVVPGSSPVPAAVLLNLSYEETSCGDGTCGVPENAISCPADCQSGNMDNLCDGIRDSRCDPDCPEGAGDPDCGGVPPAVLYLAGFVVLAVAGAGVYLYLVRKKSS
jgi:putative hemolysin